jgi:hypothetical protein
VLENQLLAPAINRVIDFGCAGLVSRNGLGSSLPPGSGKMKNRSRTMQDSVLHTLYGKGQTKKIKERRLFIANSHLIILAGI